MDTLLQGIPSVICYIDDILLTGLSTEEHLQTLSRVLRTFEEAGLCLNKFKYAFLQPSIEYLGHIIDKHEIHPTEEKVDQGSTYSYERD